MGTNTATMQDIAEIETKRLRLTAFNDSHFNSYAAMLADPACTHWVGDGHTLDRMNAWRSMAMLLGHWQLRGYGMWALEERATGTFIGRVGLMCPEGWPDIDLGWMLHPDHRHHGYATEAGEAALQFAWETLRVPRVISLIREGDESSLGVVRRLGAEYIEDINFIGPTTRVFAYYPPAPPTAK